MPRPLLHHQQKQEQNILSATAVTRKQNQLSMVEVDYLLRKPRSKAYMQACQQLDAGGHTAIQQQVQDVISQIQGEFPDVELPGYLLGIVAKCYLGKPYEVHTLDMSCSIIEHYKQGQALPGGLEKARHLASMGSYAFIEVYTDCCRAVSEDGSVSVLH